MLDNKNITFLILIPKFFEKILICHSNLNILTSKHNSVAIEQKMMKSDLKKQTSLEATKIFFGSTSRRKTFIYCQIRRKNSFHALVVYLIWTCVIQHSFMCDLTWTYIGRVLMYPFVFIHKRTCSLLDIKLI